MYPAGEIIFASQEDLPLIGIYLQVIDRFYEAIEYLEKNLSRADQLTDYGKEQIMWLVKAYWEDGTEKNFPGHSDYAVLYSMLLATVEGIVQHKTIAPTAIIRYKDTIKRLQTFKSGSWTVRTSK